MILASFSDKSASLSQAIPKVISNAYERTIEEMDNMGNFPH